MTAELEKGGSRTPEFTVVIRGYERSQVDAYRAATATLVARLERELAEARRQCRLATEHAEAVEVELREVREAPAREKPVQQEDGFGFRAEKLLRMAEQEAAAARGQAVREAAQLTDLARAEAETHRQQVTQALLARRADIEQRAAEQTAAMQEREQRLAAQLDAARQQADQLHAAAVRAADQLQQRSVAAAEATRRQADLAAKRRLDEAAQEIARLSALEADIRSELRRLAQLLADGVGRRAGDLATARGVGTPA